MALGVSGDLAGTLSDGPDVTSSILNLLLQMVAHLSSFIVEGASHLLSPLGDLLLVSVTPGGLSVGLLMVLEHLRAVHPELLVHDGVVLKLVVHELTSEPAGGPVVLLE